MLGHKKTGIAVIGVSGRGRILLDVLLSMSDVEIPAICGTREEKLKPAAQLIFERHGYKTRIYTDYKLLLEDKSIDGVIVSTSWVVNPEITIAAMRAGKYVGCEVRGAASIEECFSLIKAREETGSYCMMLENCCYDRKELALLNMARQGVFGELIHCQCGYQHDLRASLVPAHEKGHYRLEHYINRNGDLYPTHGLGPVCKLLDINRGNRMLTLTSIASKARGLSKWIRENRPVGHELHNTKFSLGDVVTSTIKCSRGETILLTHDTTLPRPYSRGGRVQGTKGIWMEDNNSIHIEGKSPLYEWEPFEKWLKEYEHPLWKKLLEKGMDGGADYLTLRTFVDCVKNGTPPPIDVYDAAAWMSITCLSEQSIAMGGIPVTIPDFTNGRWVSSN